MIIDIENGPLGNRVFVSIMLSLWKYFSNVEIAYRSAIKTIINLVILFHGHA
jgi:hypothetical protein